MSPRIVGVIGAEPFDRRTWSGASHHFFSALERTGALAGAVSAVPPTGFDELAKAAAFWPRKRRWKERYEFSPVRRAAFARYAGRRTRTVDPAPDVLLQCGAYFDLTRVPGPVPRLRCSFHDSNLALFARLWSDVEDAAAAHIRRELRREREVFDGIDVIMTMSEWLRQSFIDDFGQDPAKVVTIGSGANVSRLPDAVVRDWSRPRILFIGLQWERKGGPEVLEAFRRLRGERPDAELWIVGQDGPDEPGVRWHGRIDRSRPEGDAEFERLHREATLFVLASHYDPMPNVFLEAMAYGLPAIGTRVCALPEMVAEGETGLLVPPGDPAALHAAMAELSGDAARSAAMGEAGRRRVHERFTWDRVAERLLDAVRPRLADA